MQDVDRIARLLRELVPQWPCHMPSETAYLPGGYTHRNFRVTVASATYALRVATAAQAAEGRYLQALPASVGPQVIAYDAERGHLLTRWIEGPVLAAAPPSPTAAGAYLAKLHRAVPQGIRRYDYAAELTALFRRARHGARLHEDVAAAAAQLRWQPRRLAGCHNDLNPWNVIRAPDGWRTLDWEQAGDNDPAFDLAGLCLGLAWSETEALACARAAAGQSWLGEVSAERLRETLQAYRIREYAWAAAQLAAGNDRPEVLAQAQAMRASVLASARQRNPSS